MIFSYDKNNGINFGVSGIVSGIKKALSRSKIDEEVASAFSKMDLKLNFFDQLTDPTLNISNEKLESFANGLSNVQIQSMSAGEAMKTFTTSTFSVGSALSSVASIAATVASSLLTMGAAMLITAAAGKLVEFFVNLARAEEIAIEKGKEATQSINDRYEAYKQLKDAIADTGKSITGKDENVTTEESIDAIAKKYDELHDGVNQLSNANEELSTEKYQEYLDLCNQLAAQSPSLVSGYDSQGNAILNLGNTAKEAE